MKLIANELSELNLHVHVLTRGAFPLEVNRPTLAQKMAAFCPGYIRGLKPRTPKL